MGEIKRVLVADDHTLFRQGLRRLLADASDLQIAGEAETGAMTLALMRQGGWDLLLLDISFPDLSGIEVLKQLQAEGLKCPVLVLSMHSADEYATQAAQMGAAGYIGKDSSSQTLIEAMRKVATGGTFLDERVAHELFFSMARGRRELPHDRLSPRELAVFMGLAHGQGVSDIARNMDINARTVSTYRMRLLEKMGFDNNAQIVRYAVQHRLV